MILEGDGARGGARSESSVESDRPVDPSLTRKARRLDVVESSNASPSVDRQPAALPRPLATPTSNGTFVLADPMASRPTTG
jgi:hypothetical protein